MLICKLAGILSSRKISITELSDKIGVSRTALSQLVNNTTKGIQYDTLNKICNYLNLTPNDVLMHYPIEVTCEEIKDSFNKKSFDELEDRERIDSYIVFYVKKGNKEYYYDMDLTISLWVDKGSVDGEIIVFPTLDIDCEVFYSEAPEFKKNIDGIPVEMKHLIDNDLKCAVEDKFYDIIESLTDPNTYECVNESEYKIEIEWS